MLKQLFLIGLILLCFKSQSQNPQQSEWDKNIKILVETTPMFDIKLYNSKNPGVAIRIKNYTIENDFLVVSVWERSTKKSKSSTFDLRCLKDAYLTCEALCTLKLVFDGAIAPDISDEKTRIEFSNCEVRSQKKCERFTWSRKDDFVKRTMQAFQQISNLNN